MKTHYDFSDTAFEQAFQDRTLAPELFNHEAHLRLAWIHLTKYGEAKAIQNICAQLVAYVAALGAEDKYNKTLTIAAIKAVNHFIQKVPIDNFQDFIATHPRLKYNFKDLMSAHYGVDIYHSQLAKTTYLEPDLLPFE